MLTPWANPMSSCVMPPKLSSKESRDLILSCVARRRNYTAGSSSLFWTEFKCAVNFRDPSPKGRASVLLKLFPLFYHTHHVSKVKLIRDFFFGFIQILIHLSRCVTVLELYFIIQSGNRLKSWGIGAISCWGIELRLCATVLISRLCLRCAGA